MSVVAFVTLYECDRCRRMIPLKNDLEYSSFDATWYAGINKHFCPTCREKDDVQPQIAADLQLQERIAATCAGRYGVTRQGNYGSRN